MRERPIDSIFDEQYEQLLDDLKVGQSDPGVIATHEKFLPLIGPIGMALGKAGYKVGSIRYTPTSMVILEKRTKKPLLQFRIDNASGNLALMNPVRAVAGVPWKLVEAGGTNFKEWLKDNL